MPKTKEKGITLVSLMLTVVITIILSTVSFESGKETLNTMKFSAYQNELKTINIKVNELYQEQNVDIGSVLTNSQKESIENNANVASIIFVDKTIQEQQEILNGFRYCSKAYIKKQWGIKDLKFDYYINVNYRYIVSTEGFEYNGIVYNMLDQMENQSYNVQYKNKNSNTGSFSVSYDDEDERYKISVTNINYSGNINNWTVKYKLNTDLLWKTANGLDFYVYEVGTYNIKVVHGDEVDLGTQSLIIE